MDGGFFGSGLAFPLRLSATGEFAIATDEQKVEDSIRIILGTAPGERLMRHEFGCGIHELVFEPNTALLRGKLQKRVEDALRRYEPRIDVLDVDVRSLPERRNELDVAIEYRLRRNNALHNMVYPFFLREGGALSQ